MAVRGFGGVVQTKGFAFEENTVVVDQYWATDEGKFASRTAVEGITA